MPVGVVGITVVIYVIVSAAYYPAFEQFVSVIDSRIHNGNELLGAHRRGRAASDVDGLQY